MSLPTAGEILRFDVADLACALPLRNVREVQRAVSLTPLPGAPRVIAGVVDLRGDVVPVLDLRERLERPAEPVRPDQFLIFVWSGERLLALRADRVAGIESPAPEDFAAATSITRGAVAVAVAGLARVGTGLLVLHDPEALLAQAEAESLETALADLGRP